LSLNILNANIPLRLEKFSIKNFRSLQDLQFNCEEYNIITLIGSISVGKSNILRSLELFWNSALYEQERKSIQDRQFFSEIQKRARDTKIEATYYFSCKNKTIEQTQFTGIVKQFLLENKPSIIVIKFIFDPNKDKKPARWVGWVPQNETEENFEKLDQKNGHGIYWMIEDPYSQYVEEFHLELGHRLIYRFRAEWDIDVELYLKKLQEKPNEKKNLEDLISRVFGENMKIEYIERPHHKSNGNMFNKAVIFRRRNKSILPFTFLSHASKRLIAMLSVLTNSNNHYPHNANHVVKENFILPKILLIDSPEIGDPRSQRALAEIFIEYSENHQIFLTTHSPRFMLGSTYLVRLYNSSTIASHINTQNDLEKVVDILGIKPSDSLSSDAVVFVEGITDAAVFRIFLKKIEENEKLSKQPVISFIPVDGWTKMTFTISLRILKSKFVRTKAFAIVDGDTWRQTRSFNRIQSSFESVFGHKSFLRLKDDCLESIFLKFPFHIAKGLDIKEKDVVDLITKLKNQDVKDKDILKQIIAVHSRNSNLKGQIYTSQHAISIAQQFTFEEIPDRIQRLFRKVLWDITH
jgi:predicted ATP-dependent endonuclease of OLD family